MSDIIDPDPQLQHRLQRALGEGYEVRALLGRGGFGVVYAAVDLRLKRDVAVKVLRPEFREWSASRERFRREAEASARLRHPNVVPIYAVGESEDIVYFVMPLIEGENLSAWIAREGKLPLAEARRVFREAAGAISAAHRAGIIHRDIKPDNILLDGRERRVLLTDFGIAKALGSEASGLTQTGAIIGSPQYMSPEQAAGERTLDHRTDIYSLGVVAYQMITGELPFTGPTVTALLVKQISEEAPPVTRRRPECPGDLAAVVARCLAKTPVERWASADDLLRALELGSEAPGVAVAAAPATLAAHPLRRFRQLVGWTALAVALLVVVDIARGQVLLAPLGFLVGAFVVAASYGRVWTAGYGWRDLLSGKTGWAGVVSTPVDSADLGPHADAVRQARSDRAAMLGLIERVPKVERQRLVEVMPTVDLLLARATDLARQLRGLERQTEPGLDALEQWLSGVRAEPPSPSRNQRLAVLERRKEAVGRLLVARDHTADVLGAGLARIGNIRAALERASAAGQGEALDDINAAAHEGREWLAHLSPSAVQ